MFENISFGINIDHYLRLLRRRRHIALAIGLLVLSAFSWGSFVMPKTYKASATVTIEKSGLINPLMEGVSVSPGEERLRKIQSTITSRSTIARVIEKLNLKETANNETQYDGLIKGIQQNISVSVRGEGERGDPDLFTVEYRGGDPLLVKNLVETLVNEIIIQSINYQHIDAESTYTFIDSQLEEYKRKLEISDKTIRKFLEGNPTMVPQSEDSIARRIENFQTSYIEGSIRLKELLKKQENLLKQLSGEKELTVAFVSGDSYSDTGISAHSTDRLEERLNKLNNELMLLLTKYTVDYPDVLRLQSEIKELQNQIAQPKDDKPNNTGTLSGSQMKALNPIYRQIKEELSKTDMEIDALKARLDELVKQQSSGREILERKPKEQEEWAKLQRDRTAYQRLYEELLQKRESARVSKNLEMSDRSMMLRIVEPPIVPRFPVSPNKIMLIIFGFLLGTASGIGAAVGRDYIDPSYKDEYSIQEDLHLPVLVSIPRIRTLPDIRAEAKFDKTVYIIALAYCSLIGLLLVREFMYRYMGVTIIPF